MHIHILGICGTFMGSLAQLAKQQGHHVTGSDAKVYPPMSDQLKKADIPFVDSYKPDQFQPRPDLVVVGNALSRGNPCVESMLDLQLAHVSGPEWLGANILANRHVISVAGTHGKTTTASMIVAILSRAGLDPGYLIGGVPINKEISATLGGGQYFVVEADEYDCAFFDKRSKFIHYRSNTLVINNIEFDHADIFPDLEAIETQFHHLLRTLPSNVNIIYPDDDKVIKALIDKGCWSKSVSHSNDGCNWQYRLIKEDVSSFEVRFSDGLNPFNSGRVNWDQFGLHNVRNAMSAIIAAHQVGVSIEDSCAALGDFSGVMRRMQIIFQRGNFTLYDDFAHHPTAIAASLGGLRARVGDTKIITVIEPGSATMRRGFHGKNLALSLEDSDQVFWYLGPEVLWDAADLMSFTDVNFKVFRVLEDLIDSCLLAAKSDAHMVIMSNTGFQGFQERILTRLRSQE